MAAKKTTGSRKPVRAKATRKTSVRSTRKAPAVSKGFGLGAGTQVGVSPQPPAPIGIDG
jgi:hypothetical protein